MNNFTDTFIESINDYIESYYIEKKSIREYRKDRFKKKYDYDPKSKTIKDGTTGKRIEMDLDTEKKTTKITDPNTGDLIKYKRSTAMDTFSDNPRIILGRNFFDVKGSDVRNWALNHEIGHTKLHSFSSSDDSLKSFKALEKMIVDMETKTIENEMKKGTTKRKIQAYFNSPQYNNIKTSLINKYIKGMISAKSLKYEIRDNILNKLDEIKESNKKAGKPKYQPNFKEIEADQYANNTSKGGSKNMKRALLRSYKAVKRQMVRDHESKEKIKEYNKSANKDINARVKLAKSNTLSKSEKGIYR